MPQRHVTTERGKGMRTARRKPPHVAPVNGELHAYLRARLGIPGQLDDSACWPWTKGLRVNVGGRAQSAARFVWTLVHGIAPRRPLWRSCATPSCVQPAHLVDHRPRAASPELNWRLRYLYRTRGLAAHELARRYRVSVEAVEAALAKRA